VKSTSEIHPAITENTEDSLVKCMPHLSMRESHNNSNIKTSLQYQLFFNVAIAKHSKDYAHDYQGPL